MREAVIALSGVALGSLATLLSTWLTARFARQQAKDDRRALEDADAQEHARRAFVDAVEALQWLGRHNLEDSGSPHFGADYAPRTARALEKLQSARDAARLASASGSTNPELTRLALDAATLMSTVEHAWIDGQRYARQRDQARTNRGNLYEHYKSWFEREWDRLEGARVQLLGVTHDMPVSEQIDAGHLKPGSILYLLREQLTGKMRDAHSSRNT